MPKPSKGENKLQYPPGVRDITEDISTDDLVRRLKDCAQAFQSMSQDDDNSPYVPLALHLATESFLEHSSKDVRLLVACCIADVFRVYAPDAPYKDPDQLKIVFEFFIQQLKGLEDPKDPIFKRYFYLLENLAWVKSFNICIELEDNQRIFCNLFNLIFRIVNDNHSAKVKNFMLDMMCPLISEADMVSQELLDIVLLQIIEPKKSQNKNACTLAQDILKRTTGAIEPYIQNFFNNALILGKTSQSEVANRLYDLIYELNIICPNMLVAVLPQLEFKLKSSEEKERLEVTKALARMFSDKGSVLAEQNKQLWVCFLGRFNDISVNVRMRCVQYSMHFLLNHYELRDDISEQLKQRNHDPEESVRYEVAIAIISAAKKDFHSVNNELLNFVKERTLDKKFKIRKEALLGLATLFKEHINASDGPNPFLENLSWIKNKVLHVYYRTSLEDRLLVERILYTCLVPYQNPLEDRMKKLYQLYASVDDHAVKAFNELLKCQHIVRTQVKSLLDCLNREKSNDTTKLINCKIAQLSRNLPESVKCQEFILKFCKQLDSNIRVKSMMIRLLSENISCSDAAHNVKEVLKTLGFPVQTNTYYMIIKQLLERVAPVMVDKDGIKHLIYCVKDSLLFRGEIDVKLCLSNSAYRGLQLLHTLSFVFPYAFHDEDLMNDLLQFLQAEDEQAADSTLQIFRNTCHNVEKNFPEFALKFIPLLESFVEFGTVKQAKHAVYCLNVAVTEKESVFRGIIEDLKKHFTLESQCFQTALVTIGHIAFICPDLYGNQLKSIVSKVVVKDLLMLDQDLPRGGDESWGPLDTLPDETKVKIEGMKLMVRWLMGLKDAVQPAVSTLRLLSTVILHQGDLMERQHASPVENSWLRFTAATCMLKLCQEKNYVESITLEQFQVLAFMMNDECHDVRERFAQKLHKGLSFLRLPVEFMAIFALGGIEEHKELKILTKQHLLTNINKRREYLKQNSLTNLKSLSMLPDYVLPYVIHLLAHAPFLKDYDDVPSLVKVKECLWFLMEPLMVKNENYSFSFFKRLIENIKQTKDKQAPNDELANLKLYAVCDLALSIVLSKTTNFVLKDFPVEPRLPSKLFTSPDKNFSNMKTYLPPELICTLPKKSGFEIEMFAVPSKGANSAVPSPTVSKKKPTNDNQESAARSNSDGSLVTGNSRTSHLSHFNKSLEKKKEATASNPFSVNNSTEGSENKAPQPDVTSPVLRKPRGRSKRVALPPKENSVLDDTSNEKCESDISYETAKPASVSLVKSGNNKRKIENDSATSGDNNSFFSENSQPSFPNDSQLSGVCDGSEQSLFHNSRTDEVLNDTDREQSNKRLRSSRSLSLKKSPSKIAQTSHLSSLKTKHNSASSPLKTRHNTTVSPLKTRHNSTASPLKTRHNTTAPPLKTRFGSAASTLNTRRSSASLNTRRSSATSSLNTRQSSATSSLSTRLSSATSPLKTRRNSMISSSKTKLNSPASNSKTRLTSLNSRTRSNSPPSLSNSGNISPPISKTDSHSPSMSKMDGDSPRKELVPVLTDLKYFMVGGSAHDKSSTQNSSSEESGKVKTNSNSASTLGSRSLQTENTDKPKSVRTTKQLKITSLYQTRNRKTSDVVKRDDASANFSIKSNVSVLLHRDAEIESLSSRASSESGPANKRAAENSGSIRRHNVRQVSSNSSTPKHHPLVLKPPAKIQSRKNAKFSKKSAEIGKDVSQTVKKSVYKYIQSPTKNLATRAQANRNAKSPEKNRSLGKKIKLAAVSNGTEQASNQSSDDQSPSKKRHTAASLLAKAIKTSSLKAKSPKAKTTRRSR